MSRQQQWALKAQLQVSDWRTNKLSMKDKLETICMKAPGLVQQSGLVQALSYFKARDPEGPTFVSALAEVYGLAADDLMHRALKAELPEYLALTRDLLEVATWIRRFAQIPPSDTAARG